MSRGLRRDISPRAVTIITAFVLAAILFAYWWGLVRKPAMPNGRPGGGGGGPAGPPPALGRDDVQVEPFAGIAPGFRDGPAWQAEFAGPNALALASDGSLYVADSRNHRIRRVTRSGVVSTVAGGAEPGGPGGMSDGPAASALFRYPSGVAIGPDGTVYVADTGNHRVCRIRNGGVETLAGGAAGRSDGQGGAARFAYPGALAIAADGALWVADYGNGVARRIDPAGRVTTPAVPSDIVASLGDVAPGRAEPLIWACPEGHGDAGPTPFHVGRRSAGWATGPVMLYADLVNAVILAQRAGGPPLLVAGIRSAQGIMRGVTDGDGAHALFGAPAAVALAKDGSAYVADAEGSVVRRLRLPPWLPAGQDPPARGRGDFGRRFLGR